jgi:hypothetical protein
LGPFRWGSGASRLSSASSGLGRRSSTGSGAGAAAACDDDGTPVPLATGGRVSSCAGQPLCAEAASALPAAAAAAEQPPETNFGSCLTSAALLADPYAYADDLAAALQPAKVARAAAFDAVNAAASPVAAAFDAPIIGALAATVVDGIAAGGSSALHIVEDTRVWGQSVSDVMFVIAAAAPQQLHATMGGAGPGDSGGVGLPSFLLLTALACAPPAVDGSGVDAAAAERQALVRTRMPAALSAAGLTAAAFADGAATPAAVSRRVGAVLGAAQSAALAARAPPPWAGAEAAAAAAAAVAAGAPLDGDDVAALCEATQGAACALLAPGAHQVLLPAPVMAQLCQALATVHQVDKGLARQQAEGQVQQLQQHLGKRGVEARLLRERVERQAREIVALRQEAAAARARGMATGAVALNEEQEEQQGQEQQEEQQRAVVASAAAEPPKADVSRRGRGSRLRSLVRWGGTAAVAVCCGAAFGLVRARRR